MNVESLVIWSVTKLIETIPTIQAGSYTILEDK